MQFPTLVKIFNKIDDHNDLGVFRARRFCHLQKVTLGHKNIEKAFGNTIP